MEESDFKYFQYNKELNYPIYLRYSNQYFSPDLLAFLVGMQFSELGEKDKLKVEEDLERKANARMLTLVPASSAVALQIHHAVESDRFGSESIALRDGYKVYRFKDIGLIVYSERASQWEMGCFENFGNEQDILAYRSVINRYLSWALVPYGVLGFWGVPIDEGIVILKPNEAQGEAIFIDVTKGRVISIDGVCFLPQPFKILRLDKSLRNRNIQMTREELLSFLSNRTTYFSMNGYPVPVRQILQTIGRLGQGFVHPKESFKPRTDLTL